MTNANQQIAQNEQTSVWLGLGANLGNRQETLRKSLTQIHSLQSTEVVTLSSLYETEPVGERDQPMFLNCVAEIKTGLSPQQLLQELKRIELLLGRQNRKRWREREIDIDILIYGDNYIDEPDLQIPHPELHNRGFVLVPLAELVPNLPHPLLDRTISELLQGLDSTDDVKKLEEEVSILNSIPSTDCATAI